MKFARVVFAIAGVWGLVVLSPLYFVFDLVGRRYPPPITHQDFYYGFVAVALVWQVAFLIIATNPIRYRPMMLVAVLEKASYMATMGTLLAQGQIQFDQFVIVSPDLVLGRCSLSRLSGRQRQMIDRRERRSIRSVYRSRMEREVREADLGASARRREIERLESREHPSFRRPRTYAFDRSSSTMHSSEATSSLTNTTSSRSSVSSS